MNDQVEVATGDLDTTQDDAVEESPVSEAEQPIYDSFVAAIGADKDDDDIKLAMIKAGAKFSNVTRLFNQYAVIEGLVMSKEDKAEIVGDAIETNDVSDPEGFKAAVAYIVDNGTNIDDKQAASAVRAACKKGEKDVYKAPRGAGGRKHIIDDIIAELVANPSMDKETMTKYIDEHGNKTAKSWEHFYQKIRGGFNKIVA